METQIVNATEYRNVTLAVLSESSPIRAAPSRKPP